MNSQSQDLIVDCWRCLKLSSLLGWLLLLLMRRYNWIVHFLKTCTYGGCLLFSDCAIKVHDWWIYAAPLILIFSIALYVLQQFPCGLFGDCQVDVKDQEAKYGDADDRGNHSNDDDDGGLTDIL